MTVYLLLLIVNTQRRSCTYAHGALINITGLTFITNGHVRTRSTSWRRSRYKRVRHQIMETRITRVFVRWFHTKNVASGARTVK